MGQFPNLNVVRHKPADRLLPARQAFGELLRWHLRRGTRPSETTATGQRTWTHVEFADAVRGVSPSGTSADRSVRNWCSGRTTPDDLRPIEVALFGPQPKNEAVDIHAEFRKGFRLAFYSAKSGIGPAAHTSSTIVARTEAICTSPGTPFGRERDIERLAATLLSAPGGGAALVLGNGGHGKTMLTRAVAVHERIVKHFGSRRWFVELERSESVEAAQAEIAQAVGLERTEKWSNVVEAIAARQVPILLLLDNLETPLHAPHQRQPTEQLLRDLVAIPQLALLASLRSQEIAGAVPWQDILVVEPLAPDPAKAMFLSIARTIDAGDPNLAFFVGDKGVLGGIPLAIHLTAHRVFGAATLNGLKRDWLKHGALLATLPGGDETRHDSLIASAKLSLTSKRMRAEGRNLFEILGQLPAGLSEMDGEAILGSEWIDGAAQLRSVGLLRDLREGRIGLLPPIRDLASRQNVPDLGLMNGWTRYFLELLGNEGKHLGKAGSGAATLRLVQNMPNIAAALLACARTKEGINAAVEAFRLFKQAAMYTGFDAEAVLETLQQSCNHFDNQVGQGKCLFIIGDRARLRGDNKLAVEALTKALNYLQNTDADREAGLCYWALGEISFLTAGYAQSQNYYHQARLRFQRAGWAAGEADCISGLAGIADQTDDYTTGMTLYDEASKIFEACGNLRSQADCLWYMAEMERVRERLETAADLFEEARRIYVSLGYLSGEADSRSGLARIATTKGELALAKSLLKYNPEPPHIDEAAAEARDLMCLAEIKRQEGDPLSVEKLLKQAEKLCISGDLCFGQAEVLFYLGGAEQSKGDVSAARGFFEKAVVLYEKLGKLIGLGHCLSSLAEITTSENVTEARRLNERALELYSRADAQTASERCRARRISWAVG